MSVDLGIRCLLVTETAGELLRRRREATGISMEELAADVGVSEGAVWQWEAGRTTPRRAVALKVDRRLGAGGEISAAFGYAPAGSATPSSGWVSLEQHVRLQDQVETLIARVQDLGAEVERLRRRVDRADG